MTLLQKHRSTLKHCDGPKLARILLQQTDYYPYGLPKPKSIAPEINPFKYSGKELYTDLSLPHYDFAARLQLPAFGLFQRPDPKASDFTWLNSYTFCAGDPVNKVDKNGMEWRYTEDENKEPHFIWVDPKDAYDKQGNLLPDHYVQAISFSGEGPKGKFDYDKNKKDNIGT